ncbi:hypothetical protein TURU_054349 [Turdus rufiventris]|nr:hypothetical protein TURU_054349 [Turdus rufiventris]
MCRQAGCGQCVSEEHQGIFHSVNLIDTVYQEEKLTFFSTLKQMRIINEKLVNEISKRPNDADMMLKNDVETIELKFGEIFKTLKMKKQQLLEDVENQRGKKEKEFQIWKKMKETHKKTIENFLKDCEKLVHECDPQCFLEVACGLNARMKTQLDVMNIASNLEKPPAYMPKKMDIKSVVNEILALELTPVDAGIIQELPYEGNESSTLLKDMLKQNTPNIFLPVPGLDEVDGRRVPTRFMSISEMSAFQNMSHEELRYKYYMEFQKFTNVFKTQNFPANKKYKFVTAEASKDKSSGTSFMSSPTKSNNTDKIKMGTLRRGGGLDKRNVSGSSAHSLPSTNAIFSETNGDLKLFNEGSGQEVSTPALPETCPDLLIKEKWSRQAPAGTVSNEMSSDSSTSFNLKPVERVTVSVSNSESVDATAERPSGVPFTFSASNNSLPRFSKDRGTFSFKKQDKRCAFPQFYLGKCDKVDKTNNQDKYDPETKNTVCGASTSPNLDSAESAKQHILFPFGDSERNWFAGPEVSNSCKVLPSSSFFSRSEKPSDKETISHMREKTPCAEELAGYGTQKPCVLGEQNPHTSESSTTGAAGTSETNTGDGVSGVSKTPLTTNSCAFSFKSNLPSPVFSFGGIVRNTSDLLTSSMFFSGNRTEKMDKEKMKSPDKTLLNLGKTVSPECADPASLQSHPKCEGSSLLMSSSKNTENAERLGDDNAPCQPLCSGLLPVEYENASSTQLATATQQQKKVKDEETVAENNCVCARREDEPEPVQFQNTPGTCNNPSLEDFVLAVNETGGMLRDSTSDT